MRWVTLFRFFLFPYFFLIYFYLTKKIKIKENEIGLIFPYHLGDLINLCLFTEDIIKNYRAKKIVFVLPKKYRNVPYMISKKVKVFTYEDLPHPTFGMFLYLIYNRFYFLEKVMSNPVKPELGKLKIYVLAENIKHEEYMKRYFKINKSLKWKKIRNQGMNLKKRLLYKFKRLKLKPKKTVIIYPMAHSAELMPLEFWQRLTEKLKEKGYDVVTNVVGNDKPIKGTIPLFIPLEEQIATAEIAGTVIGVRSGIFDLLAYAKCKKIILYTGKAFAGSRNPQINFYKIHSLKNRNNYNLHEMLVLNKKSIKMNKIIDMMVNDN